MTADLPSEPPQEDSDAVSSPSPGAPGQAKSRLRFVVSAVLFELSLGAVALLLGWAIRTNPLETIPAAALQTHLAATAAGCLAALPLLLGLLLLDRYPPERLRAFRDFCAQHLVPLFEPLSVLELGLLAVSAGLGEELLFRGLLQHGLTNWLGGSGGMLCGLAAASLLFGACHWLNFTYAVLTALVGLYLGCLLLVSQHLLVPVATHAFYDFVALVYLTRWSRSDLPSRTE